MKKDRQLCKKTGDARVTKSWLFGAVAAMPPKMAKAVARPAPRCYKRFKNKTKRIPTTGMIREAQEAAERGAQQPMCLMYAGDRSSGSGSAKEFKKPLPAPYH